MMMLRLFTLMLLLCPAAPALAADGDGLLLPTLKMLGALALVLGVVLLLYAASRRGLGLLPRGNAQQIEVLETRSLGPKKGICLVRVRGEEYLLGLGADRVELISRLGRPGESSFEEQLQQQSGRRS